MESGLETKVGDFDYENDTDMALTTFEVLTTKKLTWAHDENPIEIPAGAIGFILEDLEKDYLVAFYDYPYTLPINKNKLMRGVGELIY